MGAWVVVQFVKHLTLFSAQVIFSQLSLSPASGSVLTVHSLLGILSPSLPAPSLLALSLSQNKLKKRKEKKTCSYIHCMSHQWVLCPSQGFLHIMKLLGTLWIIWFNGIFFFSCNFNKEPIQWHLLLPSFKDFVEVWIALSLNRFIVHTATALFGWCFTTKIFTVSHNLHISLISSEVRDSSAFSPSSSADEMQT